MGFGRSYRQRRYWGKGADMSQPESAEEYYCVIESLLEPCLRGQCRITFYAVDERWYVSVETNTLHDGEGNPYFNEAIVSTSARGELLDALDQLYCECQDWVTKQ